MTKEDGDWLDRAHLETQAIRAGIRRSSEGEHSEPIHTTSSFIFDSPEDAAARFSGDYVANVYSRYTNPTVRGFEQRLAAMEEGEAAVATASGMAAILATCMALLKSGDHVICSRDVFGSTVGLFEKYLGNFGVETSFVSLRDPSAWRAAARPSTRLLFCETPSNPLCEVADLAALAQIANDQGALLVVDNCFCTPALQRPLNLGADLVIHSATKYLDGQGRVLGGAVVGAESLMEELVGFLRTCGPAISPFNAWVCMKGLETLSLRMQAHCQRAQHLAEWLQTMAPVNRVNYAGLPDHPGYDLAVAQQEGFGGVLSFEVQGGQAAAWQFIRATELMSLTANLGDAKTTIVHPATTTHSRLTQQQRDEAGISDGLIRIAVGLEHIEDIKADCDRGFAALLR
ncbi:O-succinylhomoserine sulfhydrylase [Luminiphilus syltensis NOR5-1B]|uniref:O-succinylhomoserine sulfhydrylase n=1 Tax=Luminiphilus syltensis NOR5-1B TaxID=565045 RepID=B8KYE3_9GAMM|nr:O-succinylhomoserine sulfhydrylase [Luminiphilus syltensis]EED35121.1 O-succinylhomoserine sulfhydrylase [Luminiphilus syltensis NOR5-1B]